MNPALIGCLQSPSQARTITDVADWWQVWQSLDSRAGRPAALAIAGGFAADRVGWAFASGYQAALRALLPELPHDTLAALCVTEAEGNRPRDIRTTIAPQPDGTLRIDGAKRWTTLGPASTLLLVVGALPAPPGATRPLLRLARVPVPTPGLVLQPMPPTRFVPEVPHAQLLMHDLRVSAGALLPHDGYDAYVKPFRTIEDLHVTLAVLAYLLREARARRWPAAFNEELVAALSLLAQLAGEDARAASTHIALAGALRIAHRLYADALPLWATAGGDPAAERWQRDAALFEVAGSARDRRAERAWQRLGALPSPNA
ncbi:MAG TPA: acyl-CoA dehydrogenase family protein [Burkholderiaceae bacterium]|nr:acyl-CoA dehydrogenase family protein [Burkholderiaceae bacterium]